MADEQKPDPSLLRPAREVASAKTISRTPSFRDWMDKSSISHNRQYSSTELSIPPTSSPRPQNQIGQVSIKYEPRSSLSEPTCRQSLKSACKDFIGPSKLTNGKFQSPYSSYKEPAMVPFPGKNPKIQCNSPAKFPSTIMCLPGFQLPNTMVNRNQVKPSLKPSIPTRQHSGLKRKTRGDEQYQPYQNPSSSICNMTKKSVDNLLCEICQVSCPNAVSLQQHLNGRPHNAKLKYVQLKRNCPGKPRCDICQIWCSDRDGLDMHFRGQRHKIKLQELELCKKNGGEKILKAPILCELCFVRCMNEDLYKMHLKGRQHATREELKRRGMI